MPNTAIEARIMGARLKWPDFVIDFNDGHTLWREYETDDDACPWTPHCTCWKDVDGYKAKQRECGCMHISDIIDRGWEGKILPDMYRRRVYRAGENKHQFG